MSCTDHCKDLGLGERAGLKPIPSYSRSGRLVEGTQEHSDCDGILFEDVTGVLPQTFLQLGERPRSEQKRLLRFTSVKKQTFLPVATLELSHLHNWGNGALLFSL
ncbi:hypothetical protein E2C01_034456 [Portunus trituberculatus]|uniref:Uncharacterized protein n=1 Tax=Portunus trituberculatus TaxID=210409 RepID=A0A5B7F2W2_PORTR|nr:hypothetical protein [Portunus trituberculatus]